MLRILTQIFTRLPSHKRAPYLNQSVTRWQHSEPQVQSLQGLQDHYNGLNIDLNQMPLTTTEEEFSQLLVRSLSEWRRDKRTAVWLQVPILHSCYIPVAARLGFEFHHAEHRYAMLKLWMQDHQPDATPRFATHQLGVGGVVIKEETREVLVVRDKNRPYTLWKFPGGLANLGEDIESTAVREVFEETGVKAECTSVLAFRQQHTQPGAFGRSDLYVVCRMRPLTFELSPCSHEIVECQWMPVQELHKHAQISTITRRLTSLVMFGLEHGFNRVDIKPEQMESIHKGLKFHLFHRPLSDEWKS
ncbi:hypothetical protein ACJMK2_030889 [Sinanodonta woodiana]|uniref:Nucleoside diphosphate-linked moiety X motif 6 n=1 Tax=Sinanodonta woodiana TaxID=1069815 RepID=A0ABD3WYI4_SINWO